MDNKNKSMKGRASRDTDAVRGYAGEETRGYAETESYSTKGDDQQEDAAVRRRTAELRTEIESTRAEMTETVDAIQDRLRPANVVSRAAEGVREATMGRVREMGERASSNALVERVRENPVPALVAAASIAWLMFGGRRSSQRQDRYGYSGEFDAYGDDGPYGDAGAHLYPYRQRTLTDAGSDAINRARDVAKDATGQMRRAGWQARSGVRDFTNERPMAAAAVAAVAGLAIGFALPETRRENELMGETRETLVERAKDAARTAASNVTNP